MKKVLILVLCLVMLLGCVACGGKSTQSSPSPGASTPAGGSATGNQGSSEQKDAPRDSISIATAYDFGTLDFKSVHTTGYDAIACVQETLWECGLDGSITPVLAESWEWPEDDHMVVHLKKGITFSNGNPLTADDVVFTLKLIRDAQNYFSAARIQTTDFERTKARDEYTLDWYLNKPNIIHYSVGAQLFIYDAESYDPDVQSVAPIGTGPYVVKEYVINSHTVLERRDDYWGELPALKTITFRVLAEPSQRVNALETGLVDAAPVALSDVDYVDSLPGIKVRGRPGSWVYLGVNISNDGKLADPEARYAIYHAIDTEAISKLVYYGKARPMRCPFTPAIVDMDESMFDHGVYAKGYDPELAKQLAEKTGLKGKTLILANDGTAEFITISEMVQNMLANIGVNVEIHSFDTASYTDIKNDKTAYDILISSGVCGNMRLGDSFVNSIVHNKIHGLKENWVHGDRYWEIMNQSLTTMDDAARMKINQELMQLYVETSPTFGLVEYDSYYAFPEDLDLDDYVDRVITIYYAKDYSFK